MWLYQKHATVNAAAASSSQNGHRDAWIKSYMRGKALKKESLLQKDAKKISPQPERSLCFKVHSWDADLYISIFSLLSQTGCHESAFISGL